MSTNPPDWSQPPPPPPPSAYGPGTPPKSKMPLVWGGVIGFVGPILCLVLGAVLAPRGDALGVMGAALLLGTLVVPVIAIVMLVPESTRRWGAGLLLGFAIALVVGFVGCIGIFAVATTTWN